MSSTPAHLEDRLKSMGHRTYIGGDTPEFWYGIGRLQYHMLVAEGLRPHHHFLDVACGSLRLGQYLIPFLEPRHYYGLDGMGDLIAAGVANEVTPEIVALKQPQFAVNFDFDTPGLDRFDFAIAQSLFTHLVLDDIALCFRKLRSKCAPSAKFFFTFFEGERGANPQGRSDPHQNWHYRVEDLEAAAQPHGWRLRYIGDWRHPRAQRLALAEPA